LGLLPQVDYVLWDAIIPPEKIEVLLKIDYE
jgi:hypothetical protein